MALGCWNYGFECRRGMGICLFWMLCVVQVEATATGRFLVQGSPTYCVSVSVIRCNSNPLHLQWVGRRRQIKKERLGSSIEQHDVSTSCRTAAFRLTCDFRSVSTVHVKSEPSLPTTSAAVCVCFRILFRAHDSCEFLNEVRFTGENVEMLLSLHCVSRSFRN
jgi:hypothetical protein